MITTSSNYDIYNAKQNKSPVWVLEFDGITTLFCSGSFGNITANHKTFISSVEINQRIDHFLDSRSGNSYAEIEIIDKDGTITSLLYSNNLLGLMATITQGFKELDDTDFTTPFIGKVSEIKINGGAYTFVIEDYFPKRGEYLCRNLVKTTTQEMRVSAADFAFTTSASISSGSSVTVTVVGALDQDLSIGDYMYIDSGNPATSEAAEIESIDQTTPSITFVTLTNSYSTSTTLTTKKLVVDSAFSTALNTALGNYTSLPFFSASNAYIKLDQEILRIDSINAAWGILAIGERGVDGTEYARHEIDTDITEVHYLTQQPLELFLQFLTTTSAGTNGNYDIGLADWGLGIDSDLIDTEGIINLQESYYDSSVWLFTMLISTQEDALNLVLNDILRPLGLYYFIGEGKIKLGKIKQWYQQDSVGTYTDSDFGLQIPSVEFEPVINQTSWNYYYDWGSGKFREVHNYAVSASVSEYGVSDVDEIKSRGMRDASGFADELIDKYHKYSAKRFCNPSLIARSTTKFANNILELGDLVNVTNKFIPDFTSGSLGTSAMLMQLRSLNTGTTQTSLELELQGKEHVNVGSFNEVSQTDVDATSGSRSEAQYSTTDSDVEEAADALYDVSAGVAVSATRVTVTVSLLAGSGDTVSITVRVGLIAGPFVTVDSLSKTFYGNILASGKGVFVFDGLSSSQYDVKVDYYARSGSTPPGSVFIDSIVYETDSAAYAEV